VKPASIRPLYGFWATRVASDVPRVTFFTKFLKYSWNWIVGVNPLPRGASVGEFRKTRHPRNVEFDKVLEICFSGTRNSRFSGIRDLRSFRSQTCEFRGSWFGEDAESRTCGSPEPRVGGGANLEGLLIRESVGNPVWKSCTEIFTNRRRSKVKVVVPKSPGFECELVAGL
jgi:hypothetical protein